MISRAKSSEQNDDKTNNSDNVILRHSHLLSYHSKRLLIQFRILKVFFVKFARDLQRNPLGNLAQQPMLFLPLGKPSTNSKDRSLCNHMRIVLPTPTALSVGSGLPHGEFLIRSLWLSWQH